MMDTVHDVCKIGQGVECCRYLTGDGDGFHCAKLYPPFKGTIDHRVAKGEMHARGDNCPGFDIQKILTDGWPRKDHPYSRDRLEEDC
jgi:hypothetical protein